MKALLVTPASCLTQQALSRLLAPMSFISRSYTAAQQQVLQQQQQQQQQQQGSSTQQLPATQHTQQYSAAHDQQQSRPTALPLQHQAAHSLWQLRGYTTGVASQRAAGTQDGQQQQQFRRQLQQQLDDELQDDPEYVRCPRADNWRPGQRHDQQQQQQQRQQQQRHRPPADSWRPQRQQQQQELHPAAITSKMMKADTPQQLLELVAQHSAAFNRIHVVAALNKAAELWPAAATGSSGTDSERVLGRQQLQHLVNMLAGPFARSMVHYSCREISSGLWAYATCQLQPPQALLSAAADAISSWDKLQGGEAKHLVTLGWALAKFGCKDRRVLAALAAALVPHVSQLSANQVSVVLWAFGRSAFRDQHLLQQLASRSRQLLLDQQQQQQGQQLEVNLGRAAARQRRLAQFDAKSLSNTVWGLSALRWQDAQVMAAAASLAAAAPLVYEFRSYEAVNLLKGFATAAAAQGDDNGSSSSIGGSSSISDDDEITLHQQVQDAFEQISKAAAGTNRALAIQLWPAASAVASATLRRLDEASSQCVIRMMWSLAALHQAAVRSQQQLQGPSLSAAATQDGRVVFGQLAAALHSQWSRQALIHATGLTVTAWALVMAQESGLVPALLLQQATKGRIAADVHATAVLRQLLTAAVTSASQGQQQQQVKVHQVADLAAAFDRLCRPLHNSGSLASAPCCSSSSSSESALLPSEASAAAEAAEAAAADSAVAAEPTSPGDERQPLLGQFAAAVAALADTAQQLAAGAAPGQLSGADTVYDVSKMLAAFGRMQVSNDALYQALLRHWTPQSLQACNSESLIGAARAATWLAMAQPDLVRSGVLPGELWEHLLQLCLKRWPRLSVRQRTALQPVSANMPAEVAVQYADVAAEFRRVVDETKRV